MAAFEGATSAAEILQNLSSQSRDRAKDVDLDAKQAQNELERARERMQRLDATVMTKSDVVSDWTKAYSRWEDFEDVENLEIKEKLAREKREALLKQQSMGCSHDHSTEQAIFDLSTAEKIRACDGFRRHGNEFFSEGQWARALQKYDLALAYYEYAFPETDDETEILSSIRVACLLNACLCHLRLRRRREALNMARQAVIAAPDNPKALYRRAQTYNELDELDKAKEDIVAALRMKPNDADFRRELSIILSKQSAAKSNLTSISQSFLHARAEALDNSGVQRLGTKHSLEALLQARGNGSARREEEEKEEQLDDLFEIPPDLSECFEDLRREFLQVETRSRDGAQGGIDETPPVDTT